MAARRKPASSQIDAIDALLATERIVTVNGTPITLTQPTEAAVRKLRRVQYALVPRDGAEPDLDQLAGSTLDLATTAVMACVQGLDRDRAFRLVLASGGEMGELARTALAFCGVGLEASDALSEGAADDPT